MSEPFSPDMEYEPEMKDTEEVSTVTAAIRAQKEKDAANAFALPAPEK